MTKSIALLSGLLSAALLSMPASADTPQISNADFELQTYLSDGTFLSQPDGWTINVKDPSIGSGAEAGGENSYGGPPSPAGGAFWGIQYLDGWGEFYEKSANLASISQDVSGLTIGTTYAISFYDLVTHTYDPNMSVNWVVSLGGETKSAMPSDYADWTLRTLTFVATSSTEKLTLAANWLGATPGATPAILNIDGLSITAVSAVPEPAEAGLWAVGLLTLGRLMRRRNPG